MPPRPISLSSDHLPRLVPIMICLVYQEMDGTHWELDAEIERTMRIAILLIAHGSRHEEANADLVHWLKRWRCPRSMPRWQEHS